MRYEFIFNHTDIKVRCYYYDMDVRLEKYFLYDRSHNMICSVLIKEVFEINIINFTNEE